MNARLAVLCLASALSACGHGDKQLEASLEQRRRQQQEMRLAHTMGLEDGALDAAMEMRSTLRKYEGSPELQAAYQQGYLEGIKTKPKAEQGPKWREPGALRSAFEHGFDLGLRDHGQGLSPDPTRHEGRYDARDEAAFRIGYRRAYPANSEDEEPSLAPPQIRLDRFY